MIPLYILGLLQRFGPQHGYQIKKIIAEQLSDFTQIKLPTIYYHLEKMRIDGLISASSEKPGNRPEKTIYSVTDKGVEEFHNMLKGLLNFDYRPTFPSDGIFYFSEHLETREITDQLKNYIEKLKAAIAVIQNHRNETLQFVPNNNMKKMVKIIFSHHEHHYRAELNWAIESLDTLSI
jgi:DNA-binding PadR family transcriptional regulator